MEVLTPASPSDLPPLGELVAEEPSWRYPSATTAGAGAAHLRVWLTTGPEPGHLAVVTETGPGTSVTRSAGRIRAVLARRYGPSVVLLEHYLAPEFGEGMGTLDLVRVGANGSPHWSRVWPTRRAIPGTPGSSCGWPPAGTRSSAGPRASSTDARTTDRHRVTRAGPRRQAQFRCPTSGRIPRHNALANGMAWVPASRWRRSA
jgi:hypothetical protein